MTRLLAMKEGVAPVQDRLTTTLFLAALAHGIVLLGVSFGAVIASPDAVPTLEVLLVSNETPESHTNPQADYLSQRTQQGSGNTRERRRPVSPQSAPVLLDNDGSEHGQALQNQDVGGRRGAMQVLASSAARDRTEKLPDAAPASIEQQTALRMQANLVSPLASSDDGDQLVVKGPDIRELMVTANTRESDVAVYLDRWRRKVERIGTLHFPYNEARRNGLSGNPVVEVAIRSNGELEDILIRRTSGHRELDQAALGILRLSTPFDPFPQELAQRHDVLRFAYEWEFLGGALVASTVRAPATP
jgi:periplasmic protein TonB